MSMTATSGSHHAANPHKRRKTRPENTGRTQNATPSSSGKNAPPAATGPSSPQSDDDDGSEAEVSIFERTSLSLASNPLPPIPSLASTLSKFTNLHKLDLSYMQPGAMGNEDGEQDDNKHGLEHLRFLEMAQLLGERDRKQEKGKGRATEGKTLAESLTWLNLSGNPSLGQTSSSKVFQGLEVLKSLFVLNLSSCSLRIMPPRPSLMNMMELRALILTHNRLDAKSLEAIPYLPNLNTLVLSHNEVTKLPASLPANLPQLTKLSVSHNQLGAGGEDQEDEDEGGGSYLPDFTICLALREVRLSHNSLLSELPAHIKHWGRGTSGEGRGLDLLDIGHCNLTWDNISSTLLSGSSDGVDHKRLRGLKSLTLAGNADVEDEEDYREKVKAALPGLTVLDNQRLVEKTKKGERGTETAPVAEDGTAQWPKRGSALDGEGRKSPSTAVGKKSKRASVIPATKDHDEKERLKKRAGLPPGEDDEEVAGGVASDEESGKQDIIAQSTTGKRKRARRGKKKDVWTGSQTAKIGEDGEEDDLQGARKKKKKPSDKIKVSGKRSKEASSVPQAPKANLRKEVQKTKPDALSKDKIGKHGKVMNSPETKPKKSKETRVAWDAQTEEPTKANSASQQDSTAMKAEDKDKKTSRAQTSVAGIVEVKRTSSGKNGSVQIAKEKLGEKKLPLLAPTGNDSLFGGNDSTWVDASGSAWS